MDLGADRFILLQELKLHIGQPESDEATDAGSVFFYGQGDHYFTATILLSNPEVSTFIGYSFPNATTGELPSNAFKIVLTAKDNTTKTIACTSVVPETDIEKPIEGGTKISLRFRITTTMPSSVVT